MPALQPKIVLHFERMEEWPRDATGKMIVHRPWFNGSAATPWETSSVRAPVAPDRMKAN